MSYSDSLPRRSSMAPRRHSHAGDSESRRSSRVHFSDEDNLDQAFRETEDLLDTLPTRFPPSSVPSPQPARPSETRPDWRTPVYQRTSPPGCGDGIPRPESAVSPLSPGRDSRQAFDDSTSTLYSSSSPVRPALRTRESSRYSFSSYRHPYDIRPPSEAYDASSRHLRPSVEDASDYSDGDEDDRRTMVASTVDLGKREEQGHRGYLSNLLDLYNYEAGNTTARDNGLSRLRRRTRLNRFNSDSAMASHDSGYGMRRLDSFASDSSQVLDPDDPTITGERRMELDDPEDIERAVMKQMSYKARRKHQQRVRIEFNISSVLHRQKFLMRLAKALMTFGAPSHRIESQLLSAARILEVDAEFIHIPGVIICSFGDQETKTSEMHFVKCSGRLSLGSLHEVHQLYRMVVHDDISARRATERLEALLSAKPLYGPFTRIALAFCLSALICPLAFGGSFLDMWIAGLGATFLCLMQISVAAKSQLYANVFEISVTIVVSFAARGLSSIRSQIFCYTAISSASIIGILPGYLILSSSLELASKNIVCGSVKMVYALIYTLFLGFGLQIGSDLYLLFDRTARTELTALAARMMATASVTGTFVSDNGTFININRGQPLTGTFTFTTEPPYTTEHITVGCYRPPDFPWYLQPFPWYSEFAIVPVFSVLSSLSNLQPLWTRELLVMVVISCVSYAANKTANHFIFNRSDVVSAIGAFAVGLLGNIYSRKMGGTAFTSMVTGVLFLVPSGLSQAGGITAQGNGIDIGGAMIAVTIGITVGLFMSQALVYMFGSRKNAAIFSF
ncbi:hypothetical protein GSI_00897 [Ganoderma sinense ZZ0214-1]|uniref:Threonine/serine exporter-like N-terminal domain-containing protein n=1 Tax=Ganoderma sinense ZZ0214-1 TaxID=1077348 RepID=A0A2G8STX4_9APHY|nr:hypothetical protein GSI_00897 [Ganoderma sinense ZZ0214-1]